MLRARPRAVAAAVGLAAAGLLGACSDDDDADGASEVPPSTVAEGPVAATAVAIGDCLNGIVLGAAERTEISSAEVVSCDQAHGLEVFATFALRPSDFELEDPSEYPGRARVVQVADQGCAQRIEELTEEPDAFGLIALWPSLSSWMSGDRTVACAVFSPDGVAFDSRQL